MTPEKELEYLRRELRTLVRHGRFLVKVANVADFFNGERHRGAIIAYEKKLDEFDVYFKELDRELSEEGKRRHIRRTVKCL